MGKKMKIYLSEIRNRLTLIFLTGLSIIIVTYLYKEVLLFIIVRPTTLFESGTGLYSFYFIFTNVTEIFAAYLQVTVFLSAQVVLIYVIYHCFNFLSPAFFNWEYLLLNAFLKLSFLIWCFSTILTNYFIIPLTWNFFLGFHKLSSGQFMSLHFEAKLNEYLDFFISLYYLCIFCCQIFTIIIFFLNFVNFIMIKKLRKLYYYTFVLFSTLISPPDIISQIFISLFLIFNYEILVIISIIKVFLIRQPIKTY